MKISRMQISDVNVFFSGCGLSSNSWIDIREVENTSQLQNEYEQLCQQHERKNKWILMVDAEVNSLKQISKRHIDTSKLLHVNSKKVNVSVENIEQALSSGTCSAVVLCNTLLKQTQIEQLCNSAKKGQTKCILLNQPNTLH